MTTRQDDFLKTWLLMEFSLNGNRFLRDASFNEMAICNFLIEGDKTASEICRKTHILKSQVNRILNEMEAKGMISREPDKIDRRKCNIHFNVDSVEYKKEHDRVMELTNAIYEELGEEKAEQLTKMLQEFTAIAVKYQDELR